ncbi:Uncharacterised protein [Bordetella pertussis]|nr:Uncharacterised protein [Bordetella pertussis]
MSWISAAEVASTFLPCRANSRASRSTLTGSMTCGSTALRMMTGSMPRRRGSPAAISLIATNRSTRRHLKPVFHSSPGSTTNEVRRENATGRRCSALVSTAQVTVLAVWAWMMS